MFSATASDPSCDGQQVRPTRKSLSKRLAFEAAVPDEATACECTIMVRDSFPSKTAYRLAIAPVVSLSKMLAGREESI